jgi:hypothetical protein
MESRGGRRMEQKNGEQKNGEQNGEWRGINGEQKGAE